ncbi:hypothetical protein BROOK1789B_216 [Bathymodiolus brooksi thiotrophic gill symbiont]|nr:hypothetical protein BROOK1789B_216 [Bathymodiolus brooksi thiotrophic gill symbiont]
MISFPQCVEMYAWILGQAYNKTIEQKKRGLNKDKNVAW